MGMAPGEGAWEPGHTMARGGSHLLGGGASAWLYQVSVLGATSGFGKVEGDRQNLCGLEEQGELSLAWHLLQELL